VRDALTYGAYRVLGALASRLPPRIAYWMAGWVGTLVYYLLPTTRRAVENNLRHVLGPDAGEAQVQAAVRNVCGSLTKSHYEFFRLGRLSLEQIARLTRIEGLEHLDQALAGGKGIILITAHLGNLEIAGQIPLAYGVPMTVVAARTRPERLFEYVSRNRSRLGLRLIPSDGPMIGLFRALKRGELICLACDRVFIGNGRVVDFFGAPTRLPDGPARVALRTGAALLPAFVTRLPDNTFVATVESPFTLPQTGDPEADVEGGMRIILDAVEAAIRRHPEQWLIASPVWPET
jgi:lauroyl/myristoyl acyltransferase